MSCKNDKLSELHYDVEPGFGSAKSLYDDTMKVGLVVTLHEVKEWLKNQSIQQRSRHKQCNSFAARFAREINSADCMNMLSLVEEDIGTYNNIISVIWFCLR